MTDFDNVTGEILDIMNDDAWDEPQAIARILHTVAKLTDSSAYIGRFGGEDGRVLRAIGHRIEEFGKNE